ncbi:integrase [Methylobacterium sp. PvR107]|nr:integrase [Methylobacterium sp. PvR107]
MRHAAHDPASNGRPAWNAGRKLGAKRALKPQQIRAIRFWLDRERRVRDRAMFDRAIHSKLRGCDVVTLTIGDLVSGGRVRCRAFCRPEQEGRPVQFELLEPARTNILTWLEGRGGTLDDYAFPSRLNGITHISTRQYRRLVDAWSRASGCEARTTGPTPSVAPRRR